MIFIGLLVRCKDEPYVTEFVNYYLQQGVDMIHIIDDNSNKEIYKDVINNEKVNIIFDNNIINKNLMKEIYIKIKNNYEWLIIVDIDEYITTKKNINKTIKEELLTTFKDSVCIKIPWVMMSCNSITNNPERLLQTNIYRWNHDNRHINNNSKQHNGTRKYLIENFNLKRVIKITGKIFTNTGIRPSILFFEKNGDTETVEFWEIEKNADDTIKETLIISVPRSKFDDACSLDMRRYQEIAVVANIGGYPMVKLEELCTHNNGKTLSGSSKVEDGEFPVMGGGMDYIGRYSNYNREGINITISKSGASAGFVKLHDTKFWAGDCFTITPINTLLDIKYLYYYLKLNIHITTSKTTGSTIPHCKWDDICNQHIQLPPLPIQQEIVTALDLIYNNAATAKAAAASVKSQMAAVVRSVGARGFERKKLGDCLDVFKTGKNQNDLIEGNYPFYMSNGISQYANTYQFDGEYVLTARCGSLNGSQYYINGKFSASDFTYVLKPKEDLNARFLYNILRWIDWTPYQTGTTMKGIRREILTNYEIPLPPLPIQHEVLAILNEMEAELTTLEQMAAKAEQRAKFILDGYTC
jgi:type I restriction enzyme S subunit